MRFSILSLFPNYFTTPFEVSIIGRAKERGLLSIDLVDVRSFATDKHRKVDDRSFGGGPGMVMMPQPLMAAIRSVKSHDSHVIYLSPQGQKLNAAHCRRLASYRHLILICGHYEGIDERVIELAVDEEISIGDYVLPSGCAAAVVVVESVSRMIEGVVGNKEGVRCDSFEGQEALFDYPHYTTPRSFEGLDVPEVLLSGDHARITDWRSQAALSKSERVRGKIS